MIKFYIYIFMLLLNICMGFYAFNFNLKYAPIKIRVFTFVPIIFILFRYIALLILFMAKNLLYLYYLKPFILGSIIFIPLIYALSIYVFMRDQNMRFDYNFVLIIICAAIYGLIIYKFPMVLQISLQYGYVPGIIKDIYIHYFYVIVIAFAMLLAVLKIDKAGTNKRGMKLLILCGALSAIDIILYMAGLEILSNDVILEFLGILLLIYALSTFKGLKSS